MDKRDIKCIKCDGNFVLSKSSFEQYQPSEMVCDKCGNKLEPHTYLLIKEYVLSREHDHEILVKTIIDTKNAEKKAILERVRKPLEYFKHDVLPSTMFPLTSAEKYIDNAISELKKIERGE